MPAGKKNGHPPESKTGAACEDTPAFWRDCLVEIRARRRHVMRAALRTVLFLGVLGSSLTGCGSPAIDGNPPAAGQSACDQAFAQAMAIDADSDTVSGIDGAIAGCQSLEAWVQAAQQHPDAFGGQDPTTLARTRCASSTDLANSAVCTDLQGN
jgi:hypothetical protein